MSQEEEAQKKLIKESVLNPETEEAPNEEKNSQITDDEDTDVLGKKKPKPSKPIINPWNTKKVQTSRYINQA